MFEWDRNNLRKIRLHKITRQEAEEALVVTERGEFLRAITAYDLDAGQKQEYLQRRLQGE